MAYYKKGGQMDLSDRIAIETGIEISPVLRDLITVIFCY